ncbi:MAG TPA: ferritin-like domain-containing protein [Xanthobacteraceae bacterium]|nr:ferritin-like domain-containing protein [Xanthobacteraceae bacterium]
MPGRTKVLEDLFYDTLRDIFYAEKKILRTLPKMARAANSPELKAAFEKHEMETEGQVERLNKIFDLLGRPARGKTCDAIDGITDEGAEVMESYKDSPALDAGLLAAAQAVEHYEISRYGTLRAWAKKLGQEQVATLLDETLSEETATDKALSQLAMSAINADAEGQAA